MKLIQRFSEASIYRLNWSGHQTAEETEKSKREQLSSIDLRLCHRQGGNGAGRPHWEGNYYPGSFNVGILMYIASINQGH